MREISSRMSYSEGGVEQVDLGTQEGGVHRSTQFITCKILPDGGDYPVESVIEQDGVRETVRSKYLIGCDGARSMVRTSIGKEKVALTGNESDVCWGVMDCVVESDFRP